MKLNQIIAAGFAAFALSACGAGSVAGTYQCQGVGMLDGLELRSDGRLYATASALGQQTVGTWEVDGDRLIGTVNGQQTVFSIVDGELRALGGSCTKK